MAIEYLLEGAWFNIRRALAGTRNLLEVRINRLHIEDDLLQDLQDSDSEGVLEIEFPGSYPLQHFTP